MTVAAPNDNKENTMDDKNDTDIATVTAAQCWQRSAEALEVGNLELAANWRALGDSITIAGRG